MRYIIVIPILCNVSRGGRSESARRRAVRALLTLHTRCQTQTTFIFIPVHPTRAPITTTAAPYAEYYSYNITLYYYCIRIYTRTHIQLGAPRRVPRATAVAAAAADTHRPVVDSRSRERGRV